MNRLLSVWLCCIRSLFSTLSKTGSDDVPVNRLVAERMLLDDISHAAAE